MSISSDVASSTMSKRKRNVLSLKDKLDIIESLKNGVTRNEVAEKYDIGLSTVADIYKREHELRDFLNSSDPSRRVMRKSANDEMDDAVYMWYQLMRLNNQQVSGSQLCEKALVFNRKLNGDATFKASQGWLQRFKSRHNIVFEQKKITAQEACPTLAPEGGSMLSDEEIIQRCLVAVKTEGRGETDAGGRDDTQDAYLDSSTGFIRRKRKSKRLDVKPKKIIEEDTIEDMKKQKLALEIEQLKLRNHLCRIEIYQAEKVNNLQPSVHTESLYVNNYNIPITEVYLDNSSEVNQ